MLLRGQVGGELAADGGEAGAWRGVGRPRVGREGGGVHGLQQLLQLQRVVPEDGHAAGRDEWQREGGTLPACLRVADAQGDVR